MSTRTATSGTIVSSQTAQSSDINNTPGGWIGYVQITGNVTGLTHVNDTLTGLTVTVTVGTSRRIMVTGSCLFNSSTAGDDSSLQIQESSTVLGHGATYMQRTSQNYFARCEVVLTPSSGSHTYLLTGGLSGGTGPVQLVASSTNPAYILIEDLGPA